MPIDVPWFVVPVGPVFERDGLKTVRHLPKWYDIVVPGTTKQSRTGKNGPKRAAKKMPEVPVKSDKVSVFSDHRFSVAPMMDWVESLYKSKS